MLISETKKFGFVHFYRTGGTWLADILARHAPAHWQVKQVGHPHDRAVHAPAGYKLFVFVRNPWDWYVSNYFFYRQHWEDKTGGYLLPRERWIMPEVDFSEMFERTKPKDGFADSIVDLVRGKYVHTQMARTFSKFTQPHNGELEVGKFENLRADAARLIEWASGEKLPNDLAYVLSSGVATNSARHKPYRSYYCPAVRDLVAECDKEIVDGFGYTF